MAQDSLFPQTGTSTLIIKLIYQYTPAHPPPPSPSHMHSIVLKFFHWLVFSIPDQMLTQACMQSECYDKVIDAVRFYARTTREVRTFETLINLMYKRPISPQFQVKKNYVNYHLFVYGNIRPLILCQSDKSHSHVLFTLEMVERTTSVDSISHLRECNDTLQCLHIWWSSLSNYKDIYNNAHFIPFIKSLHVPATFFVLDDILN